MVDFAWIGLLAIFALMLVGAPFLTGYVIYTSLHPADFWQNLVSVVVALFVAGLVFAGCLVIVLFLLG